MQKIMLPNESVSKVRTDTCTAEKKLALSDFAIWTDTTLEAVDAQLERICKQ